MRSLALAVVLLAVSSAALPAQKILQDPQAGYNLYAHNWIPLQGGVDSLGQGNYVYFIPNTALTGRPARMGDAIRKCWPHHYLRGGRESVTGGPALSAWSFYARKYGSHGLDVDIVLASVGEVGSGSDVCIAPYTVNPFVTIGGYQLHYSTAALPGFQAVEVVFFSTVQGGGPLPIPAYGTLNNGLCLSGNLIYELQHGYNGSHANQQYLVIVSVDEITYPDVGGLSGGDSGYGMLDWGGVVNNGGVVSYTRHLEWPRTGNFGSIILFPGQSTWPGGGCDGIEALLGVAFTETASAAGRFNGCLDGASQPWMHYGAGGSDWVSCATTMAGGDTTNTFDLRALDYAYAQYQSPGSTEFDPDTDYWVEWLWFCSPPLSCDAVGGEPGAPTPYDGRSRPLDLPIPPDFWTNAFDQNPKARANVKWSRVFAPDVTAPSTLLLVEEGAEGAARTDPIQVGAARTRRGDPFFLSLCHPKAVNVLAPDRVFYVQPRVWCGDRTDPLGEPGPGSVVVEHGLVERIAVH